MIEREFYIETGFENLARLLESVTSRYAKPDIIRLGEHVYLTLQGAIPDYTRGNITITGAQIIEDDEGNIPLPPHMVTVIEFYTVAVRETRLKVTARCGFENVLFERFAELLREIEKAYPEATIGPLASDAEAEKEITMHADSLPAYKRRTLEARRAALLEDYEAATAQLNHEIAEVNRKRIERQIAALEQQITEIEAQLQGRAPQTSTPATPPGPEPPALQIARRALAHLETQAGAYAMSEIPAHLQLNLEEKRKQVEELEARWRAGKL